MSCAVTAQSSSVERKMRLKRSKGGRRESGERVRRTTGEAIGWAAGRLVRLEGDEHGDFREGGEPVIEFDLAGLEEAIGAGLDLDHGADGEAGWEDAAETRGDEALGGVGAGKDVERDKLNDAAGRAEGGIEAALVTDGPDIALDDGRETHGLAANKIDGSGVGKDLAHATDDAPAENNRGADGEVEVFAFADGETLPPARKIAAHNAGMFGAVAGVRRQAKNGFEAGDLTLHLDVLLDREIVGSVEAGEIATGFDQLAVRAEPQGPVFLEIAGVGRSDADRGGELEKRRSGERFDDGRDDEPSGDDKPEGEKRASLIEAFGHGAQI